MSSPCFPTPEEAEKLVAAGYKDRLALTQWGDQPGKEYFLIAPKINESTTGCTFLTNDGLCILHDKGLKPLEGRLTHHSREYIGLREWMCRKWRSLKGIELLFLFAKDAE